VLRPHSRGNVHAASADPLMAPEIRFNAFSSDYDVDTIVAGMKIARRIVSAAPMAPFHPVERTPGDACASDAELAAHVRAYGNSCFHPSGTCRMGTGPEAVVDPKLKVRGVQG